MQNSPQNVPLFEALKDTSFSQFVTLKLIKLIYILGAVAIAVGVVITALGGFALGFWRGVGGLILAPIAGLLGMLVLRVYLELIAVVFRIARNTREIADNTSRSPAEGMTRPHTA